MVYPGKIALIWDSRNPAFLDLKKKGDKYFLYVHKLLADEDVYDIKIDIQNLDDGTLLKQILF